MDYLAWKITVNVGLYRLQLKAMLMEQAKKPFQDKSLCKRITQDT